MKKQSHPLLIALQQEFAWLEDRDLRVGTIYLNPKDVTTLSGLEDFDTLHPSTRHMIMKTDPQPGIGWGMLWGAHVRALLTVPEGYVATVPDGMILSDLHASACIRLDIGQK